METKERTRQKHTAGPWSFAGDCEPLGGENSKRGSALQVWESCGFPRVIAEVVSTEEESIGYTEGIANAYLIAAAPDLLAALRGLLEDDLYSTKHHADGRAAIAKATGEGGSR